MEEAALSNYELAMEDSLKKRIRERSATMAKIEQAWEKFQGSSHDITSIIAFMREFLEHSTVWWKYSSILEEKGKVIEKKVTPILQENHGMSFSEASEAVGILSHPENPSFYTVERKRFLNICAGIIQDKESLEAIRSSDIQALENNRSFVRAFRSYKKDYFFIKTNFYDRTILTPALFAADIKAEIRGKSLKDIKNDISSFDTEARNLKKKKKDLLSRIKLSDEEKKNIRFAVLMTEWHDTRKLKMMKQFFYLYDICHKVADIRDVRYDFIAKMMMQEFLKFLETGKALEQDEYNRRKGDFAILYQKGRPEVFFYGRDVVKILDACKKRDEKTAELKGAVASKGRGETRVLGKVRIVKDPAKDLLNTGDILVTSMTRIEFVPLMKKAKAIITDEGGIACHAAIVSRELGIPCITGTKSATDSLRDGDKVEMDMHSGSIRLKSKSI
ncbi:hypothetical protein GF351_04260 [Candidatus Woesearchaeota archaeon]|nr:hypothetical protein [Candidatus Woesearchaeota archaeon]